MSIDTSMYTEGVSQKVRELLRSCPDYSENPGACKIYGNCRWMGINSEDLAVKWIQNCIDLQEANRRGISLLEKEKART